MAQSTSDPDRTEILEHPQSQPDPESREEALDETLESSFPASDPPSSIPDPGEADSPRTEEQQERPRDPDSR